MNDEYMKLHVHARIYLLLVCIKCLFVSWRTDKQHFYELVHELRLVYARKGVGNKLLRILFDRVLIPNYRLKANVRLGRPSPAIYRKYFELIRSIEYQEYSATQERKRLRYLLIRDGAMGDVLMLTPVVRALFELHSGEISIDVATHVPSVFKNNPYVNDVMLPKQLVRGVRTYDVVIDLNGLYERMVNTHPIHAYAKAVLGERGFNKKLELYSCEADRLVIDNAVKKIGAPFVVVHQFVHDWPNRTIASKIWADAIDAIASSGNLKVIYVGTERDLSPGCNSQHEDHRTRYSLQQLSLLISHSRGFIGGDSGPSHVAATTDVPIAVFYTCAHHEARMPLRSEGRFLPIFPNLDCYGCLTKRTIPRPGYYCERIDNACVNSFVGVQEKIRDFFIN